MSPEEHLNRIVAKCRELLAVAEKRTPGKWIQDKSRDSIGDVTTQDLDGIAQTQERIDVQIKSGRVGNNSQRDYNAVFIAACAGHAEAGWRATIAAIEYYLKCSTEYGWSDAHPVKAAVTNIIAAWPEEIL